MYYFTPFFNNSNNNNTVNVKNISGSFSEYQKKHVLSLKEYQKKVFPTALHVFTGT